MEPLISVVIPMYNVGPYIKGCLDSVEEQTYRNYEIILVDDGSTDITLSKKELSKYSNLKYIRQVNGGVTAARRTGVANANGDYIYFLDSDDSLKPEELSSLAQYIGSDVDVVIGSCKDKTGAITPIECMTLLLTGKNFPSAPWNKLFKKSLFNDSFVLDIPRAIVRGEDTLMLIRVLNMTYGKVLMVPDNNYRYNTREGQVSSSFGTTSDYETAYHRQLLRSISNSDQDTLMPYMIKSRLNALALIMWDLDKTHDYQFRKSEWYNQLLLDIKKSKYKLSRWEWILLRIATPKILPILWKFFHK